MTGALLITLAALLPPASQDPPPAGQAAAQAATRPETTALAGVYFEFLQALTAQGNDDFDGAVAALRRAIALAPRSADLQAELASVFAEQGRAYDAVTAAEAALAIDPAHPGAHRILGFVQAAVADNIPSPADQAAMRDEAIRHFERALEGDPADLGVEYRLAAVYLMRGRADEAVAGLNRFLIAQASYPDAWGLLSQAHLQRGDFPAAIKALEELVRLKPASVDERRSLALLYERGRRWTDAADQWARLADLADPEGPQAVRFRLSRATALANGGDTGAARAIVQGVVAERPGEASAWYLLSQLELGAGRLDEAQQAAEQLAAAAPSDPRGVLARADVQAARGNYDQVVSIVRPRVDDPPPADLGNGVHGRLAGTMAGALQEQGDMAGAVDVMEAAGRRTPDDLDLAYNLGTTYARAERYDDAERTFRAVIAREPEHANALNYLGFMLADRGQKLDEALGLVERALELEPDNPSFLDSLGWAYFRLGRFDDAVAPLERAAREMTAASVVQAHLGDLYFQLKRYRDAAAAYDRALAGDQVGVDAADVTRKRDRARELSGR